MSVVTSPLPVLSAAVVLQADTNIATAGYFRLSWLPQDIPESASLQYQLQESSNVALLRGRIIYRGPDLARVISGKADGEYYYRIRVLQDEEPVSDWSDITKVVVAHHSFGRAISFFLAGAVVFFALLSFILIQHKKN